MSAPSSPSNQINRWIENQDSPIQRHCVCECLCHSRKISMIMLENIDKQNEELKLTIDKLNATINLILKIIDKSNGT